MVCFLGLMCELNWVGRFYSLGGNRSERVKVSLVRRAAGSSSVDGVVKYFMAQSVGTAFFLVFPVAY